MSELFPEPLTPVTEINAPSGIHTSMFFRLFCLAPRMQSVPEGWYIPALLEDNLLLVGTGIAFFPDRY